MNPLEIVDPDQTNVEVLITDTNGMPRTWADLRDACQYHTKGKVVWTVGDPIYTYRGGKNAYGMESRVDIQPVMGTTGPLVGEKWLSRTSVFVERICLYKRDRNICAYCGLKFKSYQLTIDHVMPKSRGGKNIWMNAVAACKPCNLAKGALTPEEWGHPLLYVPYIPTAHEKFIMKGKRVLFDQMEFLKHGLPKHSRLLVDGVIQLN